MATGNLPATQSNPFEAFSSDDRLALFAALSSYEAVLRRRINAEKNPKISAIIEVDLSRIRVLMSNSMEV